MRIHGVALGLATALIIASVSGCSSPLLGLPGGRLKGEIVREPVEDWSFADSWFLDLETRPDDPYSVELNYVVRDGKLYVDPAEGRIWLDHIRADPRVRVRLGCKVYPATAVLAGEPGTLEGFPKSRFVYRLDSRVESAAPGSEAVSAP